MVKINPIGAFFGTVLLFGSIMITGEFALTKTFHHVIVTLLTALGMGVIFKLTEDMC